MHYSYINLKRPFRNIILIYGIAVEYFYVMEKLE